MTRTSTKSTKAAKPGLLAGGNAQIAKADGDAPVQAYLAAIPGWKRDVGRRIGRYLDIHGDDELNEEQLVAWVRQASQLPAERM